MDTKILYLYKETKRRCHNGENPPRPIHKTIPGRGRQLVIEDGMSAGKVATRLSLPKSNLENWVRAAKAGKLGDIGKKRRPLTEVEVELARVKRALAITKMERGILKKGAANFATESLHGTR